MAAPLSRRALAQHTAEQLLAGDKQALPRLAAYIVDAGRRKEATLIARDIERALLGHGVCCPPQGNYSATKAPVRCSAGRAARAS